MTNSEFRFLDYFHILCRYWLFALILAIAGGMAAYFFSNVQPEVFEAYGYVPVSFRPGALITLKTLEKDASLDIVLDVVRSETILGAVNEELTLQGITTSTQLLAEITSVTMINDALVLSVLDSDKVFAKTVAEVWGQTTYQQLQTWVTQAGEIKNDQSIEEACFAASAGINQLVCSFSGFDGFSEAETIEKTTASADSAGMIAALWIGEPGEISVVSHQFNLGLLILAGFLSGTLLYALLALILLSNRIR